MILTDLQDELCHMQSPTAHTTYPQQMTYDERTAAISNNLKCNIIDFANIKCFKMSLLSCDLSRYTRL